MAESPAHTFGQIIGNVLEDAVDPIIREVADKYGLFLDKQGPRPARKNRKKVTWKDSYENKHDLDYVLEEGGTPGRVGRPRAFIEIAWRRYTKHSKNKAQEIQGAVRPLVDTHWRNAPFSGAILAGEFTGNAVTQLKSLGFKVLLFPYSTVVEAFSEVGIDASFDEDTPIEEFQAKLEQWNALGPTERVDVTVALRNANKKLVEEFGSALEASMSRSITAIHVLPLHGQSHEFQSAEEAISFIADYEGDEVADLAKVEVIIRYSNGDKVDATFREQDAAAEFLRSYMDPPLTPVE